MPVNLICHHFQKIIATIALIGIFAFGLASAAWAQTIVSNTFNPATRVLTAVDSAGNAYTADLSSFSPTAASRLPGTFTPAAGGTQPVTFTVTPVGGGQFAVTGISPTQLTVLGCSVNTVTTSASCQLAGTPHSLSASIQTQIHSQAETVIEMISDRLRTLSRGIAEGSAASPETPPGGTVILKDFSSEPKLKYGGLSAGSDVTRWGVWGSASGSFLKNDAAANGFDGSTVVALAGIDYLASRQWILGLSAGYTHADLSLSPSAVQRRADGALVGPYAAYIFDAHWAADALINWTSLSNSISAQGRFPAETYHSNRATGAFNLNYFTTYDAIKLTGYGGYTYSWEGDSSGARLGSALGSNVRYGALRLGGEAGYPIGAFEPYVPLRFEYQTTTPNDGTSRAALVVGAGLRYRWSDSLTGGLLFETTEVKTHTRDMLVAARLRWTF